MAEKPKRIIERTNHTSGLYGAAFDRVLSNDNVHVVLDVAAGDSSFAQELKRHAGKRVIRVDRDYARQAPEGDDWLADDATALSLQDKSVDVAVSAFMLQHLTPDEQRKAIAEMLRVARPYEDGAIGIIGLFPVYRPSKLQKSLEKSGFGGRVAMTTDYDAFERLPIAEGKLEGPTFWIPNWQDASRETQTELINAIVESGAFYRRTTLTDLARRVYMAHTGNPTIDLQ